MEFNLKFITAKNANEIAYSNLERGLEFILMEIINYASSGSTHLDDIELKYAWVEELMKRGFQVKILKHIDDDNYLCFISWF